MPTSAKKRGFPRLTIPLLIGLILAMPLSACGTSGKASAIAQTGDRAPQPK